MKAIVTRAAVTLGAVGIALALGGCGAAPDGSEGTESTEQAATSTTVTLNAVAFGNWTKTGVRTSNEYLVGTVGGVEHAGYFVFDLTSVAGKTVTAASITLNNAASGFRENITQPKPGLRVPFRPIGNTSIATLTTGQNTTSVFANIENQSASQDFSYDYLKSATGSTVFGLLTYDATRIPDIVKSAKAGTQFAIATWASNVNSDTEVRANGTGDQFAYKGVTTTPQLHLTVH